jgi:hypothetical protein
VISEVFVRVRGEGSGQYGTLRKKAFGDFCRSLSVVKFHPITGLEGTDGELRYSSTLSVTSVLVRALWSTPRSGHFTPRKDPVLIVWEAGWAPGTYWTVRKSRCVWGSNPNRPARS